MVGRVWVADEDLWTHLLWFTRLRWGIIPALYAVGKIAEWLTHGRFEPRAAFVLVTIGCAANGVYELLLHRWRGSHDRRRLLVFAQAQITIDLTLVASVVYFTGGGNSPFWPFLCAPVMGGALFFASLRLLGLYTSYALALLVLVSRLSHTQIRPGHLVMLALLLPTLIVIVHYYSERLSEAHLAALQLERLRIEKASSDELGRRKDHILSLVSHELGNPVAALRGFIYAAQMSNRASPEVVQVLSRMDHQVERLTRVVRDLYDVASIQNGTLAVDPRPCDLAAVTRELAVRFQTVRPGLRLVVEAAPEIVGIWDPVRIDQLLTNLVENAAKYAGEAAGVTVFATRQLDSALLEVRDQGPGIELDKQRLIFDPFQRFDAGRSRSGLGLGLTIAREIAVLHGGSIEVASQPGQGASFRVRLPIRAD